MNLRSLERLCESHGADTVAEEFTELIENREIGLNDVSIRQLAQAFITDEESGDPVGARWVEAMNPTSRTGGYTLLENTSGVSMSLFTNITGQLLYTAVMEAYESESFVLTNLVPDRQTQFSGEKIPGVEGLTDEDDMVVKENMPFPELTFGDDYVETPETEKRGRILSITKEAIFFDRTGLVLRNAQTLGEYLGRNKEKRIVKAVFGITNNYKRKGTSYNTYLTSGAWINKLTGSSLTDWRDFDSIENLFDDMLDPNTNEPIIMPGNLQLCHMPAKKHTVAQILGAREVETRTNSGNTIRRGPNSISGITPYHSRTAYREIINSGVSATNAKEYMVMGDISGAFEYQVNWPITVVSAPQQHQAQFEKDIDVRFKVSERGSVAVREPRKVVQWINA